MTITTIRGAMQAARDQVRPSKGAQLEARQAARRAHEDKQLQAHQAIGLLVRQGRRVFYVNSPTYRESFDVDQVVAFLSNC